MNTGAPATARTGTGLVMAVLASSQFLMTLDSSVMNVSMATVAADLDTPITGIQTAITLYTLVMASLMITGGKVGTIMGRRRAFGLGLIIYAAGSLTTALAPNLGVLLLGWSFLEGAGAALIMPAIVAMVAANFPAERRAAAYGLVAAAGAIAVAAGPLIGGAVTTFASWRYVFLFEFVIVLAILLVLRKVHDVPPAQARLDLVGSALSVAGLSMVVYGVLRSAEWGWIQPKPGGPTILGLSPVAWLLIGGLLVLYAFMRRTTHLAATGRRPTDRSQPVPKPAPHGRAQRLLRPVPGAGRRVLYRPAVPFGGTRAERTGDRNPDLPAVRGADPGRCRNPRSSGRGPTPAASSGWGWR